MTVILVVLACIVAAAVVVIVLQQFWPREMADDEPTSADVIDAWALVPLDETPLFWETVAALPVAGEMAARFAADVEQMLRDGAA